MNEHQGPAHILPGTTERVPLRTKPSLNEKIKINTLLKIKAAGSDVERINARLKQIDFEWDTDRIIIAHASIVILLSIFFTLIFHVYWLVVTSIVTFFLLFYALQGWCPPLPFLRRRGIRTQREIENERFILKIKRHDLEHNQSISDEEFLTRLEH